MRKSGYAVTARPSAVAPRVIPALRQWTAGDGDAFEWTDASRLVVDPSAASALATIPSVLAADLQAMTGTSPAVVSGTASDARAGDMLLTGHTAGTPTQPEGYALVVGPVLTVSARTGDGLFNATRSVLQLLHQSRTIPPGSALDWPSSPERGLSIDVGRKYFTIPWLQRRIKDLAYLKYNYLHLHLTENIAFRLECSTVPGITAPEHYTKAEIADLVALAARYHITVIPEIDMPGHLGALLAIRPDLALEGAPGAIDISKADARDLLRRLVTEYLSLFPGPYFSIGADEYIDDKCYGQYSQLHEYARTCNAGATPKDAFYCFVNGMVAFLRQHGKATRIWNDALTSAPHVIALDPAVVVDYWTATASPGLLDPDALATQGNKVMNASWTAIIDGTRYTTLYYVLGETLPAPRPLYELWNPTMFDQGRTLTVTGNLAGAQFNIWCDQPTLETEDQIADGIWSDLRALAQKTWGTPMPVSTYAGFQAIMTAVGSPVPLGSSMGSVRQPDGRILVVATGPGGTVSVRTQRAPNAGWGGWVSLGGTDVSSVSAVVTADGRVEVVAVGPYGRLSTRTQRSPGSEQWTGWNSSLGGTDVRQAAAATDTQGRVNVFALGGDKSVWTSVQQVDGSWSHWDNSLGGTELRSLSAAGDNAGSLHLFAVGGDGQIWQRSFTRGAWSPWDASLAGVDLRAVTASAGAGGADLYALGGDLQAYGRFQDAAGNWTGWIGYLGSNLQQLTGTRNADGRRELFALGSDGRYYARHQQTSESWTGWLDW